MYDWEQRKLGDDKDVRDGTHDSPKYHQEGHPLVTSKNLNDYGLDMTDVSLISDADFEAINKRSKVDNGDILFGMIGTIGNPVIVDRSDFAIKNVALIKEGGDIPNRFLIQLLKSSVFEKYIRNENAGNTQKFLGLSKIREFTFFTPTTEEQIRIATFFKQLDDTIALHQRKLTLLEQLKQTYLQVMFPQGQDSIPILRFAGHSEPWEQHKLGEISESYSGGTPSVAIQSYYGGSIPFIRSAEINSKNTELYLTEEGLNNSSAKLVDVGDILYALYGATSGEVGISQINGAINQAILAIKPKIEYDSNFIMQWLRRQKMSIISTYLQGGQGNLSGSIVKDLALYAPTKQEEQTKIGSFFKQLDDTIALHQEKIAHLKVLKSTLLNKMFI